MLFKAVDIFATSCYVNKFPLGIEYKEDDRSFIILCILSSYKVQAYAQNESQRSTCMRHNGYKWIISLSGSGRRLFTQSHTVMHLRLLSTMTNTIQKQKFFLSFPHYAVVGASTDQSKFGTKVLPCFRICHRHDNIILHRFSNGTSSGTGQ